MKNITKEQITQTISDASKEINNNLMQEISDCIQAFKDNTNVDIDNPSAQIIAAVSLVQGKTNTMLEKVLTELLCD